MLYFVIPRTPTLAYNNQALMSGDDASINWSRTPANFTFNANMSLALDGRSSYVPPRVSNIQVVINDLGSTPGTVQVGTGTVSSLTASTKQYTPLNVPITFKYTCVGSVHRSENVTEPRAAGLQTRRTRSGTPGTARAATSGPATRPARRSSSASSSRSTSSA